MKWLEDKSYASGLSWAGHSHWRLPTKDELAVLSYPPCTCKGMMDVVNDWYWSSSPHAYDSNSAWGVHFDNGYVGNRYVEHSLHVRAVRTGQ